jgi:hypothetical protein
MKVTIDTEAPPEEIAATLNEIISEVFVTTREAAVMKEVVEGHAQNTFKEKYRTVKIAGRRLYWKKGLHNESKA